MWKNFKDSSLIPSEFTICGSKYNVNIAENSSEINNNLGDFCLLKHEIRLAKIDDELEVPEDELLKTYLHELGHCFNYYYNTEYSEEFANAFANFFYEYLHTKE